MHTILPLLNTNARRTKSASASKPVRTPHYETKEESDTLKMRIFIPGVSASGVEITRRGPDLIISASKTRFVRANWEALHLEKAQLDYRLRLRLGNSLDYDALTAELIDGRLMISLPKKNIRAETTRRAA